MRAVVLREVVSLEDCRTPLELVELPSPHPKPGEVVVRNSACDVCNMEFDEIDDRTAAPEIPVIPGQEIAGRVVQLSEREVSTWRRYR